jgi:hypothetical protein
LEIKEREFLLGANLCIKSILNPDNLEFVRNQYCEFNAEIVPKWSRSCAHFFESINYLNAKLKPKQRLQGLADRRMPRASPMQPLPRPPIPVV